ncbi:HD-GYP domain-containing protein [Ectothiorhodospira magna]|uniref:HD-GYP domain-containing protein n=1 Tax=Ectothiorhodospira magna TaxID=867345 RepID=UPI00192E3815
MLKKIGVEDLKLGMYIAEFCGSWMEHPFWRTSFLLSNPKDLERIQSSSIQALWIDCSKGLDVDHSVKAVTQADEHARVSSQLRAVAETDPHPHQQQVSMEEELLLAKKTLVLSRSAMAEMFAEARMGNAVNMTVADNIVEQISRSIDRNPHALISLCRLKKVDEYTYMHSLAVSGMMMALARELAFDEGQIREAGLAGLLHDLGKAFIPLDILNKPGKLTDQEFTIIKSHPEQGTAVLHAQGMKDDSAIVDVCLHHHEKMDGSGYPANLNGDQISTLARMGAVCDVYDAITSNRPYKAGWDPAISLHKMMSWTGHHFDPVIFQAFVKTLGIYPIGSLVRLSSERLAIVEEQSQASLLKPIVKAFYSIRQSCAITPIVIDLSRPGYEESIIQREDPGDWDLERIKMPWQSPPV